MSVKKEQIDDMTLMMEQLASDVRELTYAMRDLTEVTERLNTKNFEERNKWYEYYLSVSLNKGYRVIIKRDVDEIFTNNYNPE